MEKLIRTILSRHFPMEMLFRSNLEAALDATRADRIMTAAFEEDRCVFLQESHRAGLPALSPVALEDLVQTRHAAMNANPERERVALDATQVSHSGCLCIEESIGGDAMKLMMCSIFLHSPTLPDNEIRMALRACNHMLCRVVERNMAHQESVMRSRKRLERTIREQAFSTVYQPIVDVVGGRTAGFEALTRFHEAPEITPDKWFSQAIEIGMQGALELAVTRSALDEIDMLPGQAYLSLNMSPEIILSGALTQALDGVPLERIVLEVTEHASVQDYQGIADRLLPFRRLGLRLAVDDAGAGYASFRHILKLQPDVIKLDRSLIERIDVDLGSRALAAAVVRFCEETCCKVVAEGVETPAEFATLRELKVDKAQGYLFGRPRAPGPWMH
mgnify:CR=1 FL=1